MHDALLSLIDMYDCENKKSYLNIEVNKPKMFGQILYRLSKEIKFSDIIAFKTNSLEISCFSFTS